MHFNVIAPYVIIYIITCKKWTEL